MADHSNIVAQALSIRNGKRRRCSRLREKATLSSISAASSLSSTVFAMLKEQQARPENLPAMLRDNGARAEWRSLLHHGHSLLFHGFGSKRVLLDEFVEPLTAPGMLLFHLDGSSSRSSVRELLVAIIEQALRQSVPAGTNVALCAYIRRSFLTSAPLASETTVSRLKLGSGGIAALRSVLHLLPSTRQLVPTTVGIGLEADCSEDAPASSESATSTLLVEPGASVGGSSSPAAASAQSLGAGASSEQADGRPARAAEPHAEGGVPKKKQRKEILDLREFVAATEQADLGTLAGAGAAARASSRIRGQYDAEASAQGLDARCSVGTKSDARASKGSPHRIPPCVYILVHSIDAVFLRADATRSILASLASLPQVHMIASCSHRNSASLWDAQQARAFNWAWIEANTAAPYAAEATDTTHELLASLQDASESSEGRSAKLVLSALTGNAQEVFKELLAHHLDEPKSPGLPLSSLFARCKAKLITTSEAALKGFIIEFIDHHLVRTRRGTGGRQCYYILSAYTVPEIAQQILRGGTA